MPVFTSISSHRDAYAPERFDRVLKIDGRRAGRVQEDLRYSPRREVLSWTLYETNAGGDVEIIDGDKQAAFAVAQAQFKVAFERHRDVLTAIWARRGF